MNHHRAKLFLLVTLFLLASCAKPEQTLPPTATLPHATETSAPPTETPIPLPTQDPLLFGALAKSEINPLASKIQEAVFVKAMEAFIASGNVLEYQITYSEVFPSSDGTLIAEIYYNVRSTNIMWIEDGGTSAENNWIMDKCNRFDFVNTEAEFQLKNRRTCN